MQGLDLENNFLGTFIILIHISPGDLKSYLSKGYKSKLYTWTFL
jgi:hypothetical protein